MPKYLSGRVKRRSQSYLSTDRYQFLGLEQAEPNLGDSPSLNGSLDIPAGQQYQIVSLIERPGERFWVPIGGGVIPGSISVFEEGSIVGTLNSITQLNFVGSAITASSSDLRETTITLKNSETFSFTKSLLVTQDSSSASGIVKFTTTDVGIVTLTNVVGTFDGTGVLKQDNIAIGQTPTDAGTVEEIIGVGVTIKVAPDGNENEVLFVGSDDFNTDTRFSFVDGLLNTGDKITVGIGGTVITTTDTGKVGIGSTTPIAKLDMNVGSAFTAVNVTGTEGQLLLITDDITSGSIFAVNDVSGMPSIDVDATGTIQLAPFGENEFVGIGTTNPTSKLHVIGDTNLADNLNVSGISTFQNKVHLLDNDVLNLGGSLGEVGDLLIFANGTTNAIDARNSPLTIRNNVSNTGGGYAHNIQIQAKTGENSAIFNPEGSVDLYYDDTKRFSTSGIGATVFGQLDTTNLSVSGVSTFSDDIFIGVGATVGFGTTAYFSKGSTGIRFDQGGGVVAWDHGPTHGTNITSMGYVLDGGILGSYWDDIFWVLDQSKRFQIGSSGIIQLGSESGAGAWLQADSNSTRLYHSASYLDLPAGLKLETSGIGVTVYGRVDTDSVLVSGTTTTRDFKTTGVSTFTGNIVPATNESADIGESESLRFNRIYAREIFGEINTVQDNQEIGKLQVNGISTFIGLSTFANGIEVVSGTATFNGNIDANANLDVDGTTTLDNTTIDGLLDINAGGQANTFKVEDLTEDRVVIVGTGGELEDSANLTFNGSTLSVGVDLDVDGHTELDDLNVSGFSTFVGNAEFKGNVSIAGTLTYEDVTNVDSIGIITARKDVHVGAGLSVVGITSSTSFESTVATGTAPFVVASTTKVTNLNADLLDNFSTANGAVGNSVVVRNAAAGFSAADVTFEDIVGTALSISGISTLGVTSTTDLEAQQLKVTGVSTFNSRIDALTRIDIGTTGVAGKIRLNNGAGFNYQILNVGGNLTLRSGNGGVQADDVIGRKLFFGSPGGAFQIYHAGGSKLSTTGYGVTVKGNTETRTLNVTGLSTFKDDVDFVGVPVGIAQTSIQFHKGDGTNSDLDALRFYDSASASFGVGHTGGLTIRGNYNSTGASPTFNSFILASGDNFFIDGGTSTSIKIRTQFARNAIIANSDNGGSGTVELYHSSGGTATKKFETSGIGATVYGRVDTDSVLVSGTTTTRDFKATGVSTFTGNIDANGALDVDGHTNLDNVNVAGVTTFATDVKLSAAEGIIEATGSTGLTLNASNGSAYARVRVAGNTRLHINSSGNVGIATDSPITKLDVREGSILVDAFNTSGDHGIFFRRGFITGSNPYNVSILAYDHSGSSKDGLSINAYDGISFCTGSNTRNEQVRITQAGYVGIGISIPDSIFHVKPLDETNFLVRNEGSTLVLASETNSGRDNNRGMALEATHFEFIEGGEEKVRIDQNGNVGIGTNDPDAKLEIHVATNKSVQIYEATHNDETNLGAGIGFSRQSDGAAPLSGIFGHSYHGLGVAARDHITFLTGGTSFVNDTEERLRIASDGKVGIGTINPQSALDVAHESGTNPLLYLRHSSHDVEGEVIRIARTDNPIIRYHSIKAMHGGAVTNNYITFNLHDGSGAPHTQQEEVLRLIGNGNIGIGTNNPRAKLHVENVIGTATTVIISQQKTYGVGSGTAERAMLDLALREANTTADNRVFGRMEAGTNSETTSQNGFLAFSVRQGGSVSEKLRITSTGVLEIERGSAKDQAIDIKTTATTGASRIRFVESGTSEGELAYSHNNNQLELVARSGNQIAMFTNGASEKLRINLDGDLLRGGTGQDIGSPSEPWDKVYANEFVGLVNTTQENVTTGNLLVTGIATFQGNVSIAGTLTYEDVTNIDSIGIITARTDVHVGAGLSVVGISTFNSVINANNGINITDSDNKSILLGVHEEMRIRHTGSNSEITDEGTGSLRLGGDQIVIGNASFTETNAVIKQGAAGYVVLKQNGTIRLQTTNSGVDITDNLHVAGITTITDSSGANLTLKNSSEIANDEDIANINIVANDGPSDPSTGAQIKFQANNTWTANRCLTDIIFKHANTASPTTLVDALRISAAPSNTSTHVSIGHSSASNTSNYYFTIKGYERSSQGASGDTVNLGIFNQSQATSATANIDFRLGQAALSNTIAARLLAGKENNWTNTASTRDGYFAISLPQDAQITERFRIRSNGRVGIGTDDPESLLSLYSDAPGEELLHFDMGSVADRRGWKFEQKDDGTATQLNLKADANGKSFVISDSSDNVTLQVHTASTGSVAHNGAYIFMYPFVGIGQTLAHIGDTDTKLEFPADNTIKFDTAGTERLRITSAGKVGIGSVTPGATLDLHSQDTEVLLRLNTKPIKNGYLDIVSDANRRGIIRFQDTDGTYRWSIGKGDSDELTNTSFHISSGNSGGNTAKLVVTSAGAVVAGGTAAQESDAVTLMPDGEVTAAGFYFSNNIGAPMNSDGFRRHTTGTICIDTASEERLRIDANGLVGIGTAADGGDAKLVIEGVTALTNVDQTVMVRDSNSDDAVGRGGNIGFGAYVDGTMRTLAAIGGLKKNSGNAFDGNLALYTRRSAQATLDQRLTILSSGEVGINDTNPSSTLTVAGDVSLTRGTATSSLTRTLSIGGARNQGSNFASIDLKNYDSDSSPTVDYVAARITGTVPSTPTNGGELVFYTSPTGGDPTGITVQERLRIYSGGLVEANSSFSDTYSTTTSISPHFRARNQNGTDNIYGGIQLRADRGNGAAAIFNIACLNSSTNYASTLVFQSRNTDGNFSEKMRIASDGKVGIGTDPQYNLHVVGTAAATNFDSLSDRRYKTNIKVIENPIEKIKKIDGVSFNWKETNEPSLGVIADDVLEVLPEIVSGKDTKSVNYNGLIGVLIEVVKDQQKQIDELRGLLDK